MNIDDLIRESIDEMFWQQPQETSEYNKVDVLIQKLLGKILAFKLSSVDKLARYSKVFSSFNSVSVRIITYHINDFNIRI